ncbi:hypothetical protein R1flu_015596 [Riccia fluitans]|uniref:Retrotransposon gag domain-containing protein n=1 Tax=Riccia fluitans TaxID=41844 RepID=A0ABD1YK91_9MARC
MDSPHEMQDPGAKGKEVEEQPTTQETPIGTVPATIPTPAPVSVNVPATTSADPGCSGGGLNAQIILDRFMGSFAPILEMYRKHKKEGKFQPSSSKLPEENNAVSKSTSQTLSMVPSVGGFRQAKPKPPPYYYGDGNLQKFEVWATGMDNYLKVYHPDSWFSMAHSCLMGDAAIWFTGISKGGEARKEKPIDSWPELHQILRKRVFPGNEYATTRQALFQLSQKGSLQEYISNFDLLVSQLNFVNAEEIMWNFKNGLTEANQKIVTNWQEFSNSNDIQDLYLFLLKLEQTWKPRRMEGDIDKSVPIDNKRKWEPGPLTSAKDIMLEDKGERGIGRRSRNETRQEPGPLEFLRIQLRLVGLVVNRDTCLVIVQTRWRVLFSKLKL